MDKKKLLITIALILVILLVAILGVKTYMDTKEEDRIDTQITTLNATYQKFKNETDRTKQIEILNSQIKELETIKKSEGPESKITESCEGIIQLMKQYLTTSYTTQISENTISNLEETDDKERIQTAKQNLEKTIKFIESENLLTSKEIKSHKTTINKLIESYNTRLEEIDKEEKAAQEAARKKKETSAKKKQEQETTTERITAPGTYPFPDHYIHFVPIDGVTGEKVYGTDYDRWEDPDTGIVYFNDGTIDHGFDYTLD